MSVGAQFVAWGIINQTSYYDNDYFFAPSGITTKPEHVISSEASISHQLLSCAGKDSLRENSS